MSNYEITTNKVGVKIHAGIIDDIAKQQVELISTHPVIRDLISIMPDAHAGAGCVIGFTGKFKNGVIPNLVGVDMGCGVLTYPIKTKEIDFARLDAFIRKNIPLGFSSRNLNKVNIDEIFEGLPGDAISQIYEFVAKALSFLQKNNIEGKSTPLQQIGTLGGGNHFIEIDKGADGFYVTIHSGSRNFGLRTANYFQDKARQLVKEMNIKVPKDLEYLPYSFGGSDYMDMLRVAQNYARLNRLVMLNIILRYFGEEYNPDKYIESVHNYISERDHIIRKGAISAHKNENVVIPLNMGAGIVLGVGKGNPDYNFSASHGAGRLYGRKDMLRRLDSGTFHSMEEFKESMKGIFTTSISRETFDESPFAYKPWESIAPYLEETVDILQVIKPVYNLKSPGDN